MDRSRIRWQNVGRLAAGAVAGGALLFVAPGLLDPPDPPPLPADVGLATGATGPVGALPEPEPIAPDRPSDERRSKRQRQPADREPEGGEPPAALRSHDRGDARAKAQARPPATVAPAAPPVAATPPIPPSTPSTVAPAPAVSPATAPAAGQHPTGPSEFGFER
jgi:hypothetical protein